MIPRGRYTGDISFINTTLMGTAGIIATTTGCTNVCDAGMLKTIKNGAIVRSIGHFDNEIDTAFGLPICQRGERGFRALFRGIL